MVCNRSHERLPCPVDTKCDAFQRLCARGDALADRCHARLFRHAPRNPDDSKASSRSDDGYSPFVYSEESRKGWRDPRDTRTPDEHDDEKAPLWRNPQERLFDAERELIAEVKRNGYEEDLTLRDGTSLLTGTYAKHPLSWDKRLRVYC